MTDKIQLASAAARLPARCALALALLALSASASAGQASFTLDPGAAGLVGGAAFTADNLVISDYSRIFISGTDFTESGYLSVTTPQFHNHDVATPGLNTDYGLFFAFSGSGTTGAGDPKSVPTAGQLQILNYQLFGYNGPAATFDVSGATPTTTATGLKLLASGSLKSNGYVATFPIGTPFSTAAGGLLSFNTVATAFFLSPNPFPGVAQTVFTNTANQVQLTTDGFLIEQGGGSINFASAVPEPGTSAMLLAGLGVMGFLARRRGAKT